ncbi:MAG TPA: DM13 domain-containing protein [Candidatus Limnocylindria bacterium]|nr:DM13 domain-containing protein [Candidatus Limnocylindria bacterium]
MRLRALGVTGIVACLAALAWYLGSPLFIRTTVNEAFPTEGPIAASASAAVATAAGSLTLASGELGYVDALHNGTGRVLLVRGGDAVVLRFENVAMTNAPDVHVYLSRETGGTWSEATSVYLGPLKATNGSFNYTVPAEANTSLYRSVVVWCRQFSVLITWADLH